MKILLTGATGFIGRNIKEYFDDKYYIVSPDRKQLNLLDEEEVLNYIKSEKFDVIIHTANTNDFKESLISYDILDRNLRMFYNLEKCSAYYGKMIYFGSGAEFDSRYYIPYMKEGYFGEHIPVDPYGFAKYTMNKIAESSKNIYNLRLFGVYGRYEQWQRRFISNAICRSIKNMPITINQNVYFDYLYIDDFCKILQWFVENEPEYHSYNVCTAESISLEDIARKVNLVTGLDREIKIFKPGYKKEYSGNNDRMIYQMGEVQFTPIEKGIEELYKYYLQVEKTIDESKL